MDDTAGAAGATDGTRATGGVDRLRTWLADAPAYPPNAGDLRSIAVLGLRLPIRATAADGQRLRSVGRLILEGLIPLAMIVLVLRDKPSRYGLRLGNWRTGLAIGLAGCAVMTPIVLALVRLPVFAGYYAPQATAPKDVVLMTALEVIPAEFFYAGSCCLRCSVSRVPSPW